MDNIYIYIIMINNIFIYIYIYIYIYSACGPDSIQSYDTIQFDDSSQYETEAGGDHPVAWGDGHVQLTN